MVEREQLVSMVRALQSGEDGAAIYETFQSDIYYYIFKTVNDPHLAEDLTQDTYVYTCDAQGRVIHITVTPGDQQILAGCFAGQTGAEAQYAAIDYDIVYGEYVTYERQN